MAKDEKLYHETDQKQSTSVAAAAAMHFWNSEIGRLRQLL